jgi:hypothetical protein
VDDLVAVEFVRRYRHTDQLHFLEAGLALREREERGQKRGMGEGRREGREREERRRGGWVRLTATVLINII